MATPTYVALATTTLGGTDSSVVFDSIPSGYRDLVIHFQGTMTASSGLVTLHFNTDTGSANYSNVLMFGTGSSVVSDSYSGSPTGDFAWYARTELTQVTLQIMDYSATDKHKTALIRYDCAAHVTFAKAFRWADTSAITKVTMSGAATTFAAGSTFSLYGIEA